MYYAQRNNLLGERIRLDLEDLREYFYQTYKYFERKGYLEIAFYGKGYTDSDYNYVSIKAPLLAPSPEIFFFNILNSRQIIPIQDNYQNYTEEELFTIIEVIYDKIGVYDTVSRTLDQKQAREEFLDYMNNILKLYSTGYIIEKKNGYIMNIPNGALINLLNEDTSIIQDETIIDKLNHAMEKYYRFNSTLDDKKSSIVVLAGILEPLRNELKTMFGNEIGVSNSTHDKLIFGIVNTFDIRHNGNKQNTDYDREIWYDWMMQYYTSVILTYYKIKLKRLKSIFN